jgi:hypothetical protein
MMAASEKKQLPSIDGTKAKPSLKKESSSSKFFGAFLRTMSTVSMDEINEEEEEILKKSSAIGSSNIDEKKEKAKKKENTIKNVNRYVKPADFEYWVRASDTNEQIYYYNTKTGETTWLAPCSICYKPGERWCKGCNVTYCEKHYLKQHRIYDEMELEEHRWIPKEEDISREEITNPKQEEYCIECGLNIATKMCNICWDPYCDQCFPLVHRVRALKEHKALDYLQAKKQWYTVKKYGKGPDYYINGETGQSTLEKPIELMNELEKSLMHTFKTHQITAETYVKQIEELQFDVEKVKYERDKLKVENMQMTQGNFQGKKKNKKGENTTQNEQDTIAPENQIESSILEKMIELETDVYRMKLLNPSNRRRGEARVNYVKSILDDRPFK